MRILVVGAGATGGYFGGRLLEAGRDVTFLVRPRRAAELAASGLRIHSRYGDVAILDPPTVTAGAFEGAFDLVLLSCKAYDLSGAIESFAPAVGPQTAILPLLNGMRHLDILDTRFGRDRVLGGWCFISAGLNERREIVHLNDRHGLSFGERGGAVSERVLAIDRLMEGARFDHRATPEIVLELWEKWVFLAALAASTCLARAAIGDILLAPGGRELILGLLEECRRIAERQGFAPRKTSLDTTFSVLTATGSTLMASMLRDIEAGGQTEADHIIGDLLARGDASMLRIAYTALKAYEARRGH